MPKEKAPEGPLTYTYHTGLVNGAVTMNVTCGVYILSAIVTLIGDLFEAKSMTTVASVIAIIAGILSIIAYVYYLRTLSQGSKMFD